MTHSTLPPGAFLADELTARKIRPRDVDAVAGWARGTTKRVMRGSVRVDQTIADGLAVALGVSASTWLALQQQWDDRPPTDVMAVHNWASNAHMLADLFRVMSPPGGRWCDLTYGSGRWWNQSVNPAPDGMVRCVGPGTTNPAPHDVVTDFRATPFRSGEFAVTAFDPPYVLKGSDAQFAAMSAAYGVDDAHRAARAATPARPVPLPYTIPGIPHLGLAGAELLAVAEIVGRIQLPKGWRVVVDVGDDDVPSIWLDGHGRHELIEYHTDGSCQLVGVGKFASIFAALAAVCGPLPEPTRKQALEALICGGLAEAARITRPGGWILAKAGRGIDGGKPFTTDDLMARHGHALGLVEVTSMWLVTTPRPQAHRGPQRSPRNNASRLTAFEVAA